MKLPRRQFVRNAALAAAAFTIVPRHVLGGPRHIAPSDRVNIAGVGVGGMGRANMQALSGMNLVAMCDVDWSYVDTRYADIPKQMEAANKRLAEATDAKQKAQMEAQIKGWQQLQEKWPKTKRYTDYREMLAKQKNIDAVVIATPDHTHALIALAAMDLGKHVYVQKPLAYWPQGIPRPAPLPANAQDLPWNMNGVMTRAAGSFGSYSPPDKLAWDLFLGPSRYIDYHPIYHPFNWRGWTDWGVGAIGDMGAHLIDSSFWSLDLDYPTTIETTSTPYNHDTYPMACTTYYEFPAKGSRPAVKMTWYDGGLTPPKPVEMGDEELNKGGGVLYIGTKGKLLHDTYGFNPRLLPKSLHESVGKPKETYARITTSHEMNWIDAIRGTQKTTSPFEYSGKLTEIMLLGVAALNAGRKINFDGAAMKVTNVADSDALLKRKYRAGWELP